MPSVAQVWETPDGVFSTQVIATNGLVVGHTLIVWYGSDFYDIATMPSVTSTAGTCELITTVDMGATSGHIKVFKCEIVNGGDRTVTIPAHQDCDIHGIVWRIPGLVTVDDFDSLFDANNTTDVHTAPSVDTNGTNRLLGCCWITPSGPSFTGEPYQPQASMTEKGETGASPFSAMMAAVEDIPSAGPTGTRTATWVAARRYGAITVALADAGGTPDIAGDLTATLPALMASATGAVTVTGTADAALPALTASVAGTVEVSGQFDATLPALTSNIQGDVTVEGTAAAVFPSLTATFDGQVDASGAVVGVLPALTADLDGTVTVSGGMTATLPALTGTFAGQVLSPQGTLAGVLPALQASFTGTSDAIDLDIAGLAGAPQTTWPVGAPETRFAVGAPNV